MTFNHGDRVKCTISGRKIDDARIAIADGIPYICQNMRDGAVLADRFGYRFSWALNRDFTDGAVSNLSHSEKSFDYPHVGDEYKDSDGDSVWVLGVCGRVIFVSSYRNAEHSGDYYTKEDLIELGYTIVQDKVEEKITTLTMDEVAKLAGVPVEQLKITKE